MRIGIDARFWGLEHAGIGRYVIELIAALAREKNSHQYTIFVRSPLEKGIDLPANFRLIPANIKHYSIEEQWLLPEIFARERLDLLHVPHFNVPLWYHKPFVVTIHDLLWHEVKGLSVTTLNPFAYLAKYLGYRLVVRHALRCAVRILVPTYAIRSKLVEEHEVASRKVVVTPEAPARVFKPMRSNSKVLTRYRLQEPFVIYTGSVYPHKNVYTVALAVKLLNESGLKFTLALASARSVFLDRFLERLYEVGADRFVRILGFVPDHELALIYASATALIQPSPSEGFGLTGLEAMATGLPVIAADTQVFKEVYGDAALYVDPQSPDKFRDAFTRVMSEPEVAKRLKVKGLRRAKLYSWRTLAKKTLKVYEDATKR